MRETVLSLTRSYLKERILVQGVGGAGLQTTDIRRYFEDLKAGPNARIGPKDFFEIASNQSGSALLLTLLVLVAVTILGIMGVNTSAVELNIARNEREVRESFYLAESAAMVGTQRLIATAPADLNRRNHAWHQSRVEIQAKNLDFRDADNWRTDEKKDGSIMQSPLDPESFITAVEWKVAPGGSLIQTGTRLYQNRIYGLCTKNGTDNLIEIGYHMRY